MDKIETEDLPRRMLDIDQVLKLVPIGRTTIFRLERIGKFPRSHYLTSRRRLWFADEVAEWQRDLPTDNRLAERLRKRYPPRP